MCSDDEYDQREAVLIPFLLVHARLYRYSCQFRLLSADNDRSSVQTQTGSIQSWRLAKGFPFSNCY